jgi:FMN phosphatase YigB (HAD superfamily)
MRFADLDAVTLDAFGTLVTLRDPVPELRRALRERGVEREADEVRRAFEDEGRYYRAHSFEGHDRESLARLRRDCVGIFFGALSCDLDPDEFVDPYIDALRFELLPGVAGAVRGLTGHGLALAVVSNWDLTLPEHLAALGLDGLPVVTSARVRVAKPDPAPFRLALAELGVRPKRTLHVGDDAADEAGAQAAGVRFAPAPLADVVQGLA